MTNPERKRKEPEFTFDCMAWLERVQAKIYEEIKDLTPEEELTYWRRSAEQGPHRKWWKQVHARGEAVRESPPGSGTRKPL